MGSAAAVSPVDACAVRGGRPGEGPAVRLAQRGVPTGHAALDAGLPGGGWPRGGLVELLPARPGIGEMGLLMPALARISTGEMAWVVCVAPPLPPHAPAWAAAGVALSRLLVTRASGGDVATACIRALGADGVGALVAWLPTADAAILGRLQQLAEARRTLIFLFRPAGAARAVSPASLRIGIDAAVAGHLSLHLFGCCGRPCADLLDLALGRPAGDAPFAAGARSNARPQAPGIA